MLDSLIQASKHFPFCMTVVDMSSEERLCVFVNNKFEQSTGYSLVEATGRNLSFLQGKKTDKNTIIFMRECFKKNKACVQDIVNYKKDGSEFINRLLMFPIKIDNQDLFIGFQHDITDELNKTKANKSLKSVQNAEINHVINNSLQVILAKASFELDFSKDQETTDQKIQSLSSHFEKINNYLLKMEDLSEFEDFKYI